MRFGRPISILVTFLVVLALLLPYIPVGVWVQPPTESMRPNIVGCSVTIYGPPTPSEGDVLWYWKDESTIIIHRVVDIRGDKLIFKGDNKEEADDPVNRSQLHAETYYNFDSGIDRDDCITITRPLFNAYFMVIGSEKRLEDSRVD